VRGRDRQVTLLTRLGLGLAVGLLFLAAAARIAVGRPGTRAGTNVEVVQTSLNLSQRLTHLPSLRWGSSRPRDLPVIAVDEQTRFQRVTGFGAAMTDSSAWLLQDELTPSARSAAMADLFGPAGIHLNFIRVPVGASDYTVNGRPYSYDDVASGKSDRGLSGFSIGHDEPYVIPALRHARAVNPRLEMLASLWSPPGWMKANDSLSNHKHSGRLLQPAYRSLAGYLVRFLKAYARSGLSIAAITPSNEPGNPTNYPGMQLDERSEARLVTEYLMPALRAARLHTQIYGHDAGWSTGSTAYARALASSKAASALRGIAWHCYFGAPTRMSTEHSIAPRLSEIVDECSPGLTPSVSEAVISSLRHWASAVALWNLALDPQGGPVQTPNYGCPGCTGVVTVDERTRSFALNLNYYELGQASSFIQPGAQRIYTRNFVSYAHPPKSTLASAGLDDVALRNPDGSKVLLAFNNSVSPIRFAVEWQRRWLTYTLAPEATVTFVWGRPA
jgi:glucosylceramidase